MKFGDYAETRAVLALAGLTIITVLVAKALITGAVFCTCFGTIFACYTGHCILDDKFPDRNISP